MFIVSFVIQRKAEKNKPHVVTYMDKAISIWFVPSVLFLLTVLAIVALGWYMGCFEFVLMLPLSLLYAGIGSSITGVIINMRALIYTPLLVAFIVGVYMLVELLAGSEPTAYWHLYFGMSFVLMMIIPGHLINSKSIQQC